MEYALQYIRSVAPQLRCLIFLNNSNRESQMPGRVLLLIFMLVVTSFPGKLLAEAPLETLQSSLEQEEASPISTVMFLVNPDQQFQLLWKEAQVAIQDGDLKKAHEYLKELHELRVLHSIRSLDEYSLFLLEQARLSQDKGELEKVAFFTRRALDLSPRSLPVLIEAFSLQRSLGMKSALSQIVDLIEIMTNSSSVLIKLIYYSIYPLLIGFTLALLLVLFIELCCQTPLLLSRMARSFPMRFRGILSSTVLALAMIAPLFFGPLWTLFIWGSLFLLLGMERRWTLVLCGFCLALWGFLIPIRENLSIWIKDPGVQTVLRVSEGNHNEQDRTHLLGLLQRRSDDGLAFYALAQLMRRHGDYDAAERSLERAEQLLGQQPYTDAQRGMIAFLKREIEAAENYFAASYEQGLRSASFLYNYSRVKFDLLETEVSKEFFEAASRKDRDLVSQWKAREDSLIGAEIGALAEEELPLSFFFSSALQPIYGVKERSADIVSVLMSGMSPLFMSGLGILLIIAALFRTPAVGLTRQFYFERYRPSRLLELMIEIIPAGRFVKAGHPLIAILIITLLAAFSFPLIGWPLDTTRLFLSFPWLQTAYLFCWAGMLIFIYYLSFHQREES